MFGRRSPRQTGPVLPAPDEWRDDGLVVTASIEELGLLHRAQVVLRFECSGSTASFRADEVIALLDRRTQRVESDTTPLAFLVAASAAGAHDEGHGDVSIEFRPTPQIDDVIHLVRGAAVARLREWLTKGAASGTGSD